MTLTAILVNPEASFNLNMTNTNIAVFLRPPVIVTGSLTAIPKMISSPSSVNFLTVGLPISEFSDNVTAPSTLILSPAYSHIPESRR